MCGEAQYVDDIKVHNMLHAALVVSTHPHARILSVDATAATKASPLALLVLITWSWLTGFVLVSGVDGPMLQCLCMWLPFAPPVLYTCLIEKK